jgi:hypothetical protein
MSVSYSVLLINLLITSVSEWVFFTWVAIEANIESRIEVISVLLLLRATI